MASVTPELVTFLKKGILFSLERGDVTLFTLGLGDRWLAGISSSSASKPVASKSIAIYRQTMYNYQVGKQRTLDESYTILPEKEMSETS